MQNRRTHNGQAMVEFALALPIFLLVIYGLIEAGRLTFIYAAVTTASREAARYGSAWGLNEAGNLRYQDCPAIKSEAKRVGILLGLQDSDITIEYDHGPGGSGTVIPDCTATSGAQTSVVVGQGDRIVVTVTHSYSPILAITPLTSKTLTSGPSARTIMGRIDMNKP